MQVIGGAAVLSICCSFLGKLSALISTIPGPVIGGVSFLLYGMIGTSGIRLLVDGKVDYSRSRNLVLTSVVFVTGPVSYTHLDYKKRLEELKVPKEQLDKIEEEKQEVLAKAEKMQKIENAGQETLARFLQEEKRKYHKSRR